MNDHNNPSLIKLELIELRSFDNENEKHMPDGMLADDIRISQTQEEGTGPASPQGALQKVICLSGRFVQRKQQTDHPGQFI